MSASVSRRRVLNETTDPEELGNQLKTVSRAFAVLQDAKTAATLRSIGMEPASLVPESLAHSSNEKIRRAYACQIEYLTKEND